MSCGIVASVSYVYPKTESAAELAPCHRCANAPVCKSSGIMCRAFDRYVNGLRWLTTPRVPSAEVTKAIAIRHAQQARLEEREKRNEKPGRPAKYSPEQRERRERAQRKNWYRKHRAKKRAALRAEKLAARESQKTRATRQRDSAITSRTAPPPLTL
jgi:hypothetical protein